MPNFDVLTRNGTTVTIAPKTEVNINGMRIIGDDTGDWNEPYNQNFVKLSNGLKDLEDNVASLGTGGQADLTNYFSKTELGTLSDFTAALG